MRCEANFTEIFNVRPIPAVRPSSVTDNLREGYYIIFQAVMIFLAKIKLPHMGIQASFRTVRKFAVAIAPQMS